MKTLIKALVPIALLGALILLAAVPAFAQGPTTSPVTTTTTVSTTTGVAATTPVTTTAPTGKTVGDSLPLSCDWTYLAPAPAPSYYSDLFYRVPYAKNTQLVIYISVVGAKADPNNFRFEVYTPYNSALRYLFDEKTVTTWDNWVGDAAGSSTPNKWELGDLSWSGMLNAGAADGYYTVDVLNFYPTAVWFNLCSRSYINNR
jgi:hypothetical protein